MTDYILTLNAGSSSLKFAIFDSRSLACNAVGLIDGLGQADQASAPATIVVKDNTDRILLKQDLSHVGPTLDHGKTLSLVMAFIDERLAGAPIIAVGHRVVHGGSTFDRPVRVNAKILQELAALTPFAPLHQPHNLSGIAAAIKSFSDAPQIACFDTAFHRGNSFIQDTYALPRSFYEEGVRRYGFHGLSYEFIAHRLKEVSPKHALGKVIVCHLGNGASICAINNGRSVSTTMGFSPLDGLPMGTRSGQIDPAVILYFLDQKGMSSAAISELLYRQSGLKGLSGISSDMRILAASHHPHAKECRDYFTARVRREIGGMAAVLEGIDAIVFCGGIGENAATIRADVLDGLTWLGVEMDPDLNLRSAQTITRNASPVAAFVIKTNEELMIARHVRSHISNGHWMGDS